MIVITREGPEVNASYEVSDDKVGAQLDLQRHTTTIPCAGIGADRGGDTAGVQGARHDTWCNESTEFMLASSNAPFKPVNSPVTNEVRTVGPGDTGVPTVADTSTTEHAIGN